MTLQPGPGGKAVGRHSGTGVNPVKVLCNKIQDWKIGKRDRFIWIKTPEQEHACNY